MTTKSFSNRHRVELEKRVCCFVPNTVYVITVYVITVYGITVYVITVYVITVYAITVY